jgi:membrane protein DedA with SNARE-associated domain
MNDSYRRKITLASLILGVLFGALIFYAIVAYLHKKGAQHDAETKARSDAFEKSFNAKYGSFMNQRDSKDKEF